MADYRCISCGEVRESDATCSCPVCGYKMFEVPYDRTEVLREEIRGFLSRLTVTDVSTDSFTVFRTVAEKADSSEPMGLKQISKQDDDRKHFPDFETIQNYVCSADKTEIFLERLHYSLEQIHGHIHTPYERKYRVSLEKTEEQILAYDEVLTKAVSALGLDVTIPEIRLPELTLTYTENPNFDLLPAADGILEDLKLLCEKIRIFIKQNNIYGAAYQKKKGRRFKPSADGDAAGDLQKCREKVERVLAKKYTVDIFSDGTEELGEMLGAFWQAVQAILTLPVLDTYYGYEFPDGEIALNDEIRAALRSRLGLRYLALEEAIYAYDFLADRTEEELFELYDQMIELDTYGLMGINRFSLMKIGESEKKLNKMIGLSGIKESIQKIKAYALANKDSEDLNVHMCFLGNPGSGKTEVARYIAGILYENKILPTKKIVEVDRSGLVSQYFGATAEKTRAVIEKAMGGVLFVDEAYALGNNSDHGITDYGKEAIDTLVKAMEDYRGKFCVILAGYKNEMLQMLSVNPGFKSRIQFTLDFPNYSRSELKDITELFLKNRNYTIGSAALERILDITDVKRKEPNFANAREIRNIVDQVIMCQNLRTAGTGDRELGIVDVNKYIRDANINLPTTNEGRSPKILTGEEELDRLVGLYSVKRMIKKIKAYAKRNKDESDFNLHMCFTGNPGTGKTEVARILSRILYDAGVLAEAKLVETDGRGLLGKFVGETGPKTEAKINDAMGGVLFIDEAYSLTGSNTVNGGATNYGDEAISVLLKEMEDRRGQFCVILAGYKDEMKNMLSTNPGFESRIQFTLEFPDYTREELGEIARAFLKKKKYDIKDAALEKILDITDYFRNQPNFANARTVRNVLDQVLMCQNLRTEDKPDDHTVILSDVEDYMSDEGIDLNKSAGVRKIGF